MPPDMVFFFNLPHLYLPDKLMNVSISEVGTPVRQIQLSLDGRMIIRMMASKGDLQLTMGSEPQ